MSLPAWWCRGLGVTGLGATSDRDMPLRLDGTAIFRAPGPSLIGTGILVQVQVALPPAARCGSNLGFWRPLHSPGRPFRLVPSTPDTWALRLIRRSTRPGAPDTPQTYSAPPPLEPPPSCTDALKLAQSSLGRLIPRPPKGGDMPLRHFPAGHHHPQTILHEYRVWTGAASILALTFRTLNVSAPWSPIEAGRWWPPLPRSRTLIPHTTEPPHPPSSSTPPHTPD